MKRTFVQLSALLALSALALYGAEKKSQLPKDLPAYGPLSPPAAPVIKPTKLENGMEVWLAPVQGFPKVAFVLAVRGGMAADAKGQPGVADLLAQAVTQGTKSRTAKQLAEEMQGAGGDLTANATADAIVIDASVLSEKTDTAITLLADIAQNAAFADQEVEIAKHNAESTLEANEAEPSFLARRALYRALFPSHPYAVLSPTQEALKNATPDELKREFARRFRPDQALLVVVGDFQESQLNSAIATAFGGWKPAGGAAVSDVPKPQPSLAKAVVYVPRPNSVQTALYLGTLGPDRAAPDFTATEVANAIYGGMFGSRLISNIREDKGYTYSPGSRLSTLRSTGVLVTRADVRNPVTAASFNEISYELNRVATTTPEEEELERAKRYLIGSLAIGQQSRSALAKQMAALWVKGLPPEELGREGPQIEKTSAQEVEQAGRRYFPAWRMTVVAVGDENVIRQEMAPFGLELQKAQ